jgi:hypothetical protein
MKTPSTSRNALVTAIVFGVAPCVLGAGIAQHLRWSGTVWLSNTGGFWPIACLLISLAVLGTVALSSSKDRTARVLGWFILTWTWLYFPLWLTAQEIPLSSALVTRDGRVFVAGEWARQPSDRVWRLTGRASDKIIRNVKGTVTIHDVNAQYRYSDSYISSRSHEEDLSTLIMSGASAILAEELKKSRSSRIALFEKRDVHEQLLDKLCRAVAPNEPRCPLKLSLSPQPEATIPGGVWSKSYAEREAIDERHVPTLVQLLTQDNLHVVDRDRVFALFMDLASTCEEIFAVVRKSSILNDSQFDELIKRLLASPGCGNEAVTILSKVNRLTEEHRRELRAKVFRAASLSVVANNATALRIRDGEVAQLALRMHASPELTPEVAVLVLEKFGERLPVEAQRDSIASIVNANGSHALAALKHVNFSNDWREKLLAKVFSDATYEDLEAAHLSREAWEELLTPTEMRGLIAVVIKRTEASKKWLNLAVSILPVRAMTPAERKTVLTGLLFESSKSALEFVSEYRHYLDPEDVNEVTYDYTKTVAPDFCLHLSHRNKNRKIDYFSDDQLQIFRNCAHSK